MGIREKLQERAQPFLEPGEQVQAAFPAQTGPTPWLAGAVGVLIYAFIAKYRVVVVTDRAVLLLKAGPFTPTKPKALVTRLPRSGPVGPPNGKLYAKLTLDGETHWVHRRFWKDIETADASYSASR
jgi:hypothetical protein